MKDKQPTRQQEQPIEKQRRKLGNNTTMNNHQNKTRTRQKAKSKQDKHKQEESASKQAPKNTLKLKYTILVV